MEYWEVRELKIDLETLIELIDKYRIPCEITVLHSFLGKFHGLSNFEYEFLNIIFNINKKMSGSHPDMEEYKVFFNNILKTEVLKNDNNDCVKEFLFEINIEGQYFDIIEDSVKSLKSCWHLDKHIESIDKSDGIPKYTHPTYHFQFGGNFIESCDTGGLGILSNPRIPHPPMDVFLGFNFIINNFYNKNDYDFVNKITENYAYISILKRAQERLWTPYFKAFDFNNTHNDFTVNKVFPLYII